MLDHHHAGEIKGRGFLPAAPQDDLALGAVVVVGALDRQAGERPEELLDRGGGARVALRGRAGLRDVQAGGGEPLVQVLGRPGPVFVGVEDHEPVLRASHMPAAELEQPGALLDLPARPRLPGGADGHRRHAGGFADRLALRRVAARLGAWEQRVGAVQRDEPVDVRRDRGDRPVQEGGVLVVPRQQRDDPSGAPGIEPGAPAR